MWIHRLVCSRSAAVSRLGSVAWCYRHTPVSGSLQEPLFRASWVSKLGGRNSPGAWCGGVLQPGHARSWSTRGVLSSVCSGLHQRSGSSFRSLLSLKARGLCSEKPTETPDQAPAPTLKETGPIPGQGLFKFKELVSTQRNPHVYWLQTVSDVTGPCTGLRRSRFRLLGFWNIIFWSCIYIELSHLSR